MKIKETENLKRYPHRRCDTNDQGKAILIATIFGGIFVALLIYFAFFH